MKYFSPLCILMAVALVSCSTGSKIKSFTEPTSGTRVLSLSPIEVEFDKVKAGPLGRVDFGLRKLVRPSYGEPSYSLQVSTLLRAVLNIRVGDSLLVRIDTATYTLTAFQPLGEKRQVQMGAQYVRRQSYTLESASYQIDLEFIRALAFADAATYRLFGRDGSIDGVFTEANVADVRGFFETYLF